MADGREIPVQFVDQGRAGGDVQPEDGFFAHLVQVLDQGAQAVAVGRDEHPLARPDLGGHLGVPVGQDPGHGVGQALGQGQLRRGEAGVAPVAAGIAGVVRGQGRGRGGVAAPPDEHLLVPVPPGGLGLVQALQGPVVPLVESPGLEHRQPLPVHAAQDDVQGGDGPGKQRSVAEVEVVAGVQQELRARGGLGRAQGGEGNVGPAGEAVLQVPGALSVPDQDQGVHGGPRRMGILSTVADEAGAGKAGAGICLPVGSVPPGLRARRRPG